MTSALIAAVNSTDYFLGYFPLGITVSQFGGHQIDSVLQQAYNTFGWIPSYTYGYTAGAHYNNMPVSLTLGGYDKARFKPHEYDFALTASDNSPRPSVRGIEVTAKNKPAGWKSSTQVLSSYNDTFLAVINSTTSYLWLPEAACNAFANAFNLTYNDTFGVYTLTNDQYRQWSDSNDFNFTFSLASADNHDNFGAPLEVAGVVNITLPLKALVSTFQGPYQNIIPYAAPAVPYFMLRKANSSTIALGRAFLQESYLITKYDTANFRIHQAAFPADPKKAAQLVAVNRTSNSNLPGPNQGTTGDVHSGLTVGQMAGLVAGILVLFIVCITLTCCIWRRNARKNRLDKSGLEDDKLGNDTTSSLDPESPRTPVARILSRITRRKQSKRTIGDDAEQETTEVQHFEAPNAEIYELGAPLPPVELDGGEGAGYAVDDNEVGTDQNLSEYELAKRRMERQLQGPVPAYAPPANGFFPPEKAPLSRPITRPINTLHIPSADEISPTRSNEGQSLPNMLPSPVSPRTGWGTNSTDLPSPVTASNPANSTTSGSQSRSRRGTTTSRHSGSRDHGTASRSNSDRSTDEQPKSNKGGDIPRAPIQRAPIDPTNIVCLGPLPDNVQLFNQKAGSRVGAGSETAPAQGHFKAEPHFSEGSLGSNYTEIEDRVFEELTRQASTSTRTQGGQAMTAPAWIPAVHPVPSSSSEGHQLSPKKSHGSQMSSGSEHKEGRIDGDELIHVPQMAAKRYSWEEER